VTNYSINKHQPGFVANKDADCDGVGSKWSLRALQEHLEGQCGVQWQGIWSQVSPMPGTHARACMMLYQKIIFLCQISLERLIADQLCAFIHCVCVAVCFIAMLIWNAATT